MADQITPAPLRALDANGDPVPGALLSFFQSGTTTPVTMYQDTAGTIPHTAEIEADEDGVWPEVYDTSGLALKAVATTPALAALPGFPIDPVVRNPLAGSAASSISFTPTTDLPYDNVQEAIEGAYATALATTGTLLIARGAFSGSEVIIELPSNVEMVDIDYWEFQPSTSANQLLCQVGYGTVGSPTWLTSYLRNNMQIVATTYSASDDSASNMVLSASAASSGLKAHGSYRIKPFNISANIVATGIRFSLNTTPDDVLSVDSYRGTGGAGTFTLLRFFTASGNISGNYRINGYVRP